VPNSGQKLDRLPWRTTVWDAALRAHIAALEARGKPVILIGDLNVMHHDCDVYNPRGYRNKVAGFCDAERAGFAAMLETAASRETTLVDVWRERNPTAQTFTYFSTRPGSRDNTYGWRLDYALTSRSLVPRVVRVGGAVRFRAPRPCTAPSPRRWTCASGLTGPCRITCR